MKRLGIDVDGVIASFSARFVGLANKRFGTQFTELDQHDWDFKPWFTSEQVSEVWDRDIKPMKNFWMTLRPMPGTNLLQTAARKAELFFITSRVPTAGLTAREQTCKWLREHFYITFPTVIVVDQPSQKIPIVKALGLENFIDDKGSTIRQMHEAGLKSYAKLSPYNSAEPFPEGVVPVLTLNEYLELELNETVRQQSQG